MKLILICSILLLYSCSANSEPIIKKINDPFVVKIMASSEIIELNQLQRKIEKNLIVRVYKLSGSEENSCFPESHGICKYKYYIATSQIDENPIVNAYFIGELGEIIQYRWEKTNQIDTAIIDITVNKYTKNALNYNKSLISIEKKYKLIVKPNKIRLQILK